MQVFVTKVLCATTMHIIYHSKYKAATYVNIYSHWGDYIVEVSFTAADMFRFVRATDVWKDGWGGGRNVRSFLLNKGFVILKWLFSTTTTISDSCTCIRIRYSTSGDRIHLFGILLIRIPVFRHLFVIGFASNSTVIRIPSDPNVFRYPTVLKWSHTYWCHTFSSHSTHTTHT